MDLTLQSSSTKVFEFEFSLFVFSFVIQLSDLRFSDLCFELVLKNFECVIRLEMTPVADAT